MACPRTEESFPACWTEGDQKPSYAGTLKDDDGNPINIAGYILTFKMDRPKSFASLAKTATIVDEVNGRFRVDWDADDLKAGLGQICSVVVDDGSGELQTSPRFTMDVKERIQ